MKIHFVRPNLSDSRSSDAMQPLVFGILAALTPPEHEITLYDERLEAIDFDADCDLAALTVETYTARRAYEISAEYQTRGVSVVMGGYHPTLAPEEVRRHADAVVIGDAEGLWEQVLEDAQRGNLRPVYSQEGMPILEGVCPDRGIFAGKKYAPLIPVYYGRGCRFACDFCSIYAFYKAKLRQRPLTELVAEIESLERKTVVFIDDNLFINDQKTREFLKAIKPLNIRWVCQISINVARDPVMLDLMAKSGCMVTQIGFESLNSLNLNCMKKKWNVKHSDYGTAIQRIYERGIMIYGSFILGYDHDTPDSFAATVDFALENKFCLANFNPITPMPGSDLYTRARREGRLLHDRWWLDPGYRYGDATFIPNGMTPEQLTKGCYWARSEFNRYSSIMRRALHPSANARNILNLGVFLAANFISRTEIHRKQGQRLGKRPQSVLETVS